MAASSSGVAREQSPWTPAQVEALGVITDVPTAASVLGIGRSAAYDLIRRDEFPIPILRAGSRIKVPVAPLLEALGHQVAKVDHERRSD